MNKITRIQGIYVQNTPYHRKTAGMNSFSILLLRSHHLNHKCVLASSYQPLNVLALLVLPVLEYSELNSC